MSVLILRYHSMATAPVEVASLIRHLLSVLVVNT